MLIILMALTMVLTIGLLVRPRVTNSSTSSARLRARRVWVRPLRRAAGAPSARRYKSGAQAGGEHQVRQVKTPVHGSGIRLFAAGAYSEILDGPDDERFIFIKDSYYEISNSNRTEMFLCFLIFK